MYPRVSLRGCEPVYLTGTYDRNLDEKGRLSLPPAFKGAFDGCRLKVISAPEREVDAVYVFTEDTFKEWLDSVFMAKGGYNPLDPTHRFMKGKLNGEAIELKIDSASRISIPEAARVKSGLDHEVSVVGNGDRLEIWDREKLADRLAAAENLAADFFG